MTHTEMVVTIDSKGRRWTGRPDRMMAIGKCLNHGFRARDKKLYTWKRGTLSLDEMRCPLCGHRLDRTSREAHGAFRVIDGAELLDRVNVAIAYWLDLTLRHKEMIDGWLADDRAPAHVREFNIDHYTRARENAFVRIEALRKTRASLERSI